MGKKRKINQVVVLGAGISGISCANQLVANGAQVLLIDAHSYIGGRVKGSGDLFKGRTLDLGAEFIHGLNTSLAVMVESLGLSRRLVLTWAQGDGEAEEIGEGWYCGYYLGKEKKFVRHDEIEESGPLGTLHNVLFSLATINEEEAKGTLEEYLKNRVSGTMLSMAHAGYSNTLCSNSKDLLLSPLVEVLKEWDREMGGEMRLDDSMNKFLNLWASHLDVRLNFPVESIDYSNNDFILIKSNNETIIAEKLVITASPPSIEKNIAFIPSLPRAKAKAIRDIKLENAIKLVLMFPENFWPDKLTGMVCSDTFVPEIWFNGPTPPGISLTSRQPPRHFPNTPHLALGFATSTMAASILSNSRDEIKRLFLRQLDEIFGTEEHKTPASDTCIGFHIESWADDPYVLGGYSTANVSTSLRDDLAEPIQSRIFFAGEATNSKCYMTLHGALDSGRRAAGEVMRSLSGIRSNL